MARKKDFQTILNELDEIIAQIESGDLSLEDALKQFQLGVGLLAEGEKQLQGVEEEVKKGQQTLDALFAEGEPWN